MKFNAYFKPCEKMCFRMLQGIVLGNLIFLVFLNVLNKNTIYKVLILS